jgi:hypothetical protein
MPTFKQATFEGEQSPAKGFKFVYPEFANLEDVVELYGVDDTMKVINSAIAARIRTKAKNDLGFNGLKPNEINERKSTLAAKYTDFVVFNEDDATKWRPDVREVTPNQIMNQIKEVNADTTLTADAKKSKLEALVAELQKVTLEYYS